MSKDYLPDGITEETFVAIVKKVSLSSAIKFQFGYHDVEDLQQKAFELALTFLQNGKFKPRGDKPIELQLTNFLRIWIHNRLSNYRRDNSCRYPNNGGSNQQKYNIMHPLKIHSQGLTNSEIFARESELPEQLSRDEVLQRIEAGLKPRNRRLYRCYLDGDEIDEVDLEKLFKAIKKILPGDAEDYL